MQTMKATNVFLCDLTHNAQTVSSEFMPYAVACIGSYLKAKINYPVNIIISKFIEELEKELVNTTPDIIAFSYYIWNSDLSLKCAEIVKKRFPNAIVIFGGPNFPVEQERQKEWLAENRHVDFYIRFEGEIPFLNIVKVAIESDFNVDAVKKSGLKSLVSYDGKDYYIGQLENRLKNLDDVPSPYVSGYLDKYFSTSLWPIVETKKGCPFGCTYCTEGYDYYNKISRRSPKLVNEELLYLAKKKKKCSMIFVADTNFLMFKEDLDVCETLKLTREKYSWPTFIGCSTGKKRKDLVITGAKMLSGAITVAASVQSMDDIVLGNIKRDNISESELLDMAKELKNSDGISYSELIACLPGDTLDSHFKSFEKLVASEIGMIKHHTLLLIEGAPLSSKESREKFKFKTMWRPVSKSFGEYSLIGEKFSSMEFEEIVVETSTLSFDDYLACRKMGLVVHYFYNDGLFEELHGILNHLEIPIWNWLKLIYENVSATNNNLQKLFADYLEDVKTELWYTKESLLHDLKKYMPEFINDKRGSNLTFKYKALLLMNDDCLKDAFSFGFKMMNKLAEQKHVTDKLSMAFLYQLKQVSLMRRESLFETKISHRAVFDYDFTGVYSKKYMTNDLFRKVNGGVETIICHDEAQRKFIEEYFENHTERTVEVASLLNRVPARNMFRKLTVCR